MPLTPFHYPVAYALYKVHKKLSLPGLIVGAMFPDFEIPAIILLFGTRVPHRLVLHSLLGVATIGTLLSVVFTVWMYPFLVSFFFKIDLGKVKRKCVLSYGLIFSCLLGGISHVFLDTANHLCNPVFWPFQQQSKSLVCSFLGGVENSSLIVHSYLLIFFAVILFINKGQNFWERLLLGE